MNKDLHDIDDLFRNSIEGDAEEVPADVWKNIEHGLDKKQAAFYKRKYFAIRAAAMLLIFAGGITIAAILHFNQPGKTSAKQNAVRNSKDEHTELAKTPIEDQASKKIIVESKKEDEQNTVLNNAFSNKKPRQLKNTGSRVEKENSKSRRSTSNSVYPVQKNEGFTVAATRNTTNQKKGMIPGKPVSKKGIELAVQQPGKTKNGVMTEQASAGTESVNSFSRTSYIDARLPGLKQPDFASAMPYMNPNSTVIALPVVPSSALNKSTAGMSGSWNVSSLYSRNISLNTLKDDDHFRDPRNNSREAKRTEQETNSFTAGIGIQKQITSSLALQSGLQYFSSETTIEPKMIFAKPDDHGDVRYQFHCSSGNSYIGTKTGAPPAIGDSIKTNFSTSSLSYLQVPLLVSYKIGFGNFSLMPSAGVFANILLSGKLSSSLSHATGDEEVSGPIEGLKPVYFSGVIQPQVNYKLNDRVSFDLNPNINFSLSPINKETAVKTYQNMIGLGAGVRVKL